VTWQQHEPNAIALRLNWPLKKELELGLTLHLIEKAGENPDWLEKFAFNWFHDSGKLISGIRKLTRSVLIPFARDYKEFLAKDVPKVTLDIRPTDKTKVFIVQARTKSSVSCCDGCDGYSHMY
jgi:hypothetical protein